MTTDERLRRYDLVRRLSDSIEDQSRIERMIYEPRLEGKKAGLIGFVVNVDGTSFVVSVTLGGMVALSAHDG